MNQIALEVATMVWEKKGLQNELFIQLFFFFFFFFFFFYFMKCNGIRYTFSMNNANTGASI